MRAGAFAPGYGVRARGGQVARRREYGEISASTRDRVDEGTASNARRGFRPWLRGVRAAGRLRVDENAETISASTTGRSAHTVP